MGKVLLTGASGFIAAHILLRFLQAGHTVVATVRTKERAEQVVPTIPQDLKSRVTFAIIPDVAAPGCFEQVIKENDFDGVIHTATPFTYAVSSPEELFNPAVHGTQNILEAAHNYGPNITRVVLLSSCAAILDVFKGNNPGKIYTEEDWCPITKEQSLAGDIGLSYYGAKTHAEKTGWDFVKAKNPKFSFVSLNPPFVFGPIINHVTSIKDIGTSNSQLWTLIDGSQKGGEIPASFVWAWVDVRDLAEAHLLAYERKDVANQRFIIAAGNYTNKEIVDTYKNVADLRYVENLPTKLAPGLDADGKPEEGLFTIDNSKSKRVLGIKYHTMEEMMKAFLESIKPLEGKSL